MLNEKVTCADAVQVAFSFLKE